MTRLIMLFLALFAGLTIAQPVQRLSRDIKLPSQKMVEFQEIDNPAAAGTTNILNANAGPTSAAAASVTSFVAQPDVPRNLVITPSATTGDVEACTITVTGTNINGATITETFAFLADASTATTGSKAFKTVSSVAWPANCESGGFGAKWSIGYGEKLGLAHCMDNAGYWLHSSVGGTKETSVATVVADDDEVEKNTADFNGTMNGSNDFDAFYFQNYRCNP